MRDPLNVLATLNAAADAIGDAVAQLPVGLRRERATGHPDQYTLDLVADRAARSELDRSGYTVLSEESGRHGRGDIIVVVDPIDGSANCSRGIGFYGPSLCAVDGSGPLAAVVLNLAIGRRFTAVRGRGATVDGLPLTSRPEEGLSLIATGDPCPYLERFPSQDVLPIYTRMSGASAHDLCLVADGSYDGYVDCINNQSLWDYLGASLVLIEAGAALAERNGLALADIDDTRPRRIMAAGSSSKLADLADLVERTHTDGAASH